MAESEAAAEYEEKPDKPEEPPPYEQEEPEESKGVNDESIFRELCTRHVIGHGEMTRSGGNAFQLLRAMASRDCPRGGCTRDSSRRNHGITQRS